MPKSHQTIQSKVFLKRKGCVTFILASITSLTLVLYIESHYVHLTHDETMYKKKLKFTILILKLCLKRFKFPRMKQLGTNAVIYSTTSPLYYFLNESERFMGFGFSIVPKNDNSKEVYIVLSFAYEVELSNTTVTYKVLGKELENNDFEMYVH